MPEWSHLVQVKRAGDSLLGIVSQGFCADKAGVGQPSRGKREQYLSNLAMKVNAKLGGKNCQWPDTPDLPPWTTRPYMVLGADVTHPMGESSHASPSPVSPADHQILDGLSALLPLGACASGPHNPNGDAGQASGGF